MIPLPGATVLETALQLRLGTDTRLWGQAPFDMFTQTMNDYHNARQIKHPDTGPASAGGYNKTSKSDFFLI